LLAKQIRCGESGPSCTFGGKHAKTAIPIALGTTEQMA
jgi:hypothetical protein